MPVFSDREILNLKASKFLAGWETRLDWLASYPSMRMLSCSSAGTKTGDEIEYSWTIFKMSMLSAAALLDELMGVDRNRAPDEKKTALHWSDPQVLYNLEMSQICHHLLWYPMYSNSIRNRLFVRVMKKSRTWSRSANTFSADFALRSCLLTRGQIWVSI